MRRTLILPLCLLSTLGCEGRYLLGDLQQSQSGSGGALSSDAGDSGISGTRGAGAGSGGDNAGAAEAGEGGAAGSLPTGLGISPRTIPEAILNHSYLTTFTGDRGTGAYTFSLLSGALPAGLNLDSSGRLSGTASEVGTFRFTVQVVDATDERASAAYQLVVSRQRWLASQSFLSSASMQTALSLVDLADPESEPLMLDSESAYYESFSGDGRWLLHYSKRSATNVELFLVPMSGVTPGAPQLLIENGVGCAWAPDSSKLACLKDTGSVDAPATQLVYFDTSRGSVGPETVLATLPPKSPAAEAAGSERELVFLDSNTIAFSYGPDAFARVEWHGLEPSAPVPMAVGGGQIIQQAPEGARVFLRNFNLNDGVSLSLVDLKLGQAQVLDVGYNPQFVISNSFEAGAALVESTGGESEYTAIYYSLNGTQLTKVGEAPCDAKGAGWFPHLAGRTLLRTQGDRLFTVTIGEAGVIEHDVPGDYPPTPDRIALDPSGTWISFQTGDSDDQDQPILATHKHWLSRVLPGGPSPALLIGQGYLGDPTFSPDARRVVLGEHDSLSPQPTEFHLFDLSDTTQIKSYNLGLPYNWAKPVWSSDSTYVAFIGGAPLTSSRPLFVVDALNAAAAPRKILECSSNPATLPGCPEIAQFQP